MIFYTLQGPTYELVIHEDKIQLVKKPWTQLFRRKKENETFNINELSQFEIIVPKNIFTTGKLHWETFKGETGTFRFTTNPVMVKKIEAYIQKRVLKNHQLQNAQKIEEQMPKKKKAKNRELAA